MAGMKGLAILVGVMLLIVAAFAVFAIVFGPP